MVQYPISRLLCVTNFKDTSSDLKKKLPGRPQSVRTPKISKNSFSQCSRCWAVKHAVELGICDWGVRRLLHDELQFYQHKMMFLHQLYEHDWIMLQGEVANLCRMWKSVYGWYNVKKLIKVYEKNGSFG